MLSLNAFRSLGREQRYVKRNPLLRAFISLFGGIGLHSRIRAGHILREVKTLSLPARPHILDAGCGHALTLFSLFRYQPDAVLHGIEIDADLVQQDRRIIAHMFGASPAVTFEQGDLSTFDPETAGYDLLISVDVLEHIEDDGRVLRAFHTALKPGGHLLLHLPLRHQQQQRIFSAFKQHTVDDHVRDEYLPEEITDKLTEAGFEVLRLRYGFGWQGELAFELNTLFWSMPLLRAVFALLTYPVGWWLAYRDVNADLAVGNSMIILARPKLD